MPRAPPSPTLLWQVGALVKLTVLCEKVELMAGVAVRHTSVPGGDGREKPWTQRRACSWDTARLRGHTAPAALTTQPVPGPNGGRGMVRPAKVIGACQSNAAQCWACKSVLRGSPGARSWALGVPLQMCSHTGLPTDFTESGVEAGREK